MKVKIRSVLKSSTNNFECFDDQQIIFACGNSLCIKEVGKNETSFICLSKHAQYLYSFMPCTNKKGVFTAERIENTIQVAFYTLTGERKAVNLTHQSSFFIDIQTIQLLADEYDNNIVYGSAKNKEENCIFLCDISKSKIMAFGYLPHFTNIKVDSRQNLTLSLCGYNGSFNYMKILRYGLSQWETQEFLYKKIDQNHGPVILHEIFMGGRVLLATKNIIYIFQGMDILQIHEILNHQVSSILKIPKGFLVLTKDQTIKLYVQDSDEVHFKDRGVIPIELQSNDFIFKMQVSCNNEQVLIRTLKNNLYRWKCQHTALDIGHSQMRFLQIQSSCNGPKQGTISISTGKRYCLLTSSNIATIWSLQRNQYVLSSQFTINDVHTKCIITSAINPDGNSFLLSFDDRIRIYKILLTKFKFYAEFFLKKCQQIVYSHGGQLVACRYGKGSNACIQIINLLRLTEVNTIKVQSEPIQVIWNQLDDEIIVSAENRTLQVFKVSENIRIYNVKFDSPIIHVRLDYRVSKILVSTENKICVLDGGDIIDEIVPSIKSFYYVFPLYGIYFIVGKNGVLYWSSSLRFENYGKFALFNQQPFHLICRNSFLVAYTSFEDIMIIECERDNCPKRASDNDVVMVEKEQIMAVFDKIKYLDSNFDILQTATQAKLQDEKNNYDEAIDKLKDQFNIEMKFLNIKFNELTVAKLKQQKQVETAFDQLEQGQVKNVNELEQMFDRKFTLQKHKYMNLEQASLEQKMKWSNAIHELEAKYHNEVALIRQQYARRMKEQVQRVQQIKRHNLEDKERLEFKFLELEEENEVAIADIQEEKDRIINQLRQKLMHVEGQYDTLLIKYHNQQQKLNSVEDQRRQREINFLNLKEALKESKNNSALLQKELQKRKIMIEQKNHIIKEQQHKISGLQKAKYVLSFRTTEIRKQLEPKDELIDKLKSELFKLDEEYKEQKKDIFKLNQKIQKYQKMNELTKQQNIEMNSIFKQKQMIHDQLCSEIVMIINTLNEREWNSAFMKLYQRYIKDPRHNGSQSKRKDDSSEQINRHLIQVEQSLHQISSDNNKSLKRKDDELIKKMDENSRLLYELNLMRKNEKLFEREKREMGVALEHLKRQLNDTYKSSNVISTRAHTTHTGAKRFTPSRDAISRDRSLLIDINSFGHSGTVREFTSRGRVRSRQSSGSKTPNLRNQRRQDGLFENEIN